MEECKLLMQFLFVCHSKYILYKIKGVELFSKHVYSMYLTSKKTLQSFLPVTGFGAGCEPSLGLTKNKDTEKFTTTNFKMKISPLHWNTLQICKYTVGCQRQEAGIYIYIYMKNVCVYKKLKVKNL
jgi:hypothetical protein